MSNFTLDVRNVKSGFDEATLKPQLQATIVVTLDTEQFMDMSALGLQQEYFRELGEKIVLDMTEF